MRIERRGYSRRPWRLVRSDGREVEVPERFDHPTLGETAIYRSIGGDTRRECEAEALALLEEMLQEREGGRGD